jgi:hypothetical protein
MYFNSFPLKKKQENKKNKYFLLAFILFFC